MYKRQDQWAWALCDAPLLLYALVKFGMRDDARIRKGIDHLLALQRDNGWPCAVSEEQGKWRGPGRKSDPCPYANLIMLQLLSALPDLAASEQARIGAESALSQWEHRLTEHPYMFYMGTDFCKLKAPLVWYDIVHVLDILSRFPYLVHDKRLLTDTSEGGLVFFFIGLLHAFGQVPFFLWIVPSPSAVQEQDLGHMVLLIVAMHDAA